MNINFTLFLSPVGRPTLEPFGLAPQIRIAKDDLGVVKTFKFGQRFHTRAEAETYALYVGKKWLDDDKPGGTEV